MNHGIPDTLDVAVGIVRDGGGRVLVNQRPAGKDLAGRWEFPGGKLDTGELVDRALARELHEELGIEVIRQRPLISFPYRHEHSSVRLHVNEVLEYQGTASGREGQPLAWQAPGELQRMDLLDANRAIADAVILPRVCLITDTARFGIPRTLERLAQHAASRRLLLIVREKTLPAARAQDFVAQAAAICRPTGSMVSVHADCGPHETGQIDAIHYPSMALQGRTLPDVQGWIGVSCHGEDELRLAIGRGARYALLSPVKPTTSHPRAKPLGWPRFQALCRDIPVPVYALGGMSLADLDDAARHGAQGIAMLGAAWE